jgi:hypothetical protein
MSIEIESLQYFSVICAEFQESESVRHGLLPTEWDCRCRSQFDLHAPHIKVASRSSSESSKTKSSPPLRLIFHLSNRATLYTGNRATGTHSSCGRVLKSTSNRTWRKYCCRPPSSTTSTHRSPSARPSAQTAARRRNSARSRPRRGSPTSPTCGPARRLPCRRPGGQCGAWAPAVNKLGAGLAD